MVGYACNHSTGETYRMIAMNTWIIWAVDCDPWSNKLKHVLATCYLMQTKKPLDRHGNHYDPFAKLKKKQLKFKNPQDLSTSLCVLRGQYELWIRSSLLKLWAQRSRNRNYYEIYMIGIPSVATHCPNFIHLSYNLVTMTLLKGFRRVNSVLKSGKCDLTLSFWLEFVIFKLCFITLKIPTQTFANP